MVFVPQAGAEPIEGYRLEAKLGAGGYGEVWKVTAPGSLTKAMKFVFGAIADARATQELKSLTRIRSVRHPFLLSLERFEIINDQLLIVTELADSSLTDRFAQCRKDGLPGIPRDELLVYMGDAADALDYMSENFGLQHLDIKPQNLLLVGGRVKVADFGLVKDLEGASGTVTGGVTPFYATPEAFDGKVTRYSDQYSLAIVYQEMLSGVRPFPGRTASQLLLQHTRSRPLLDPLPVYDRPIVARALSKIAEERFPTCRAMVNSLIEAGKAASRESAPAPLPSSGPAGAETRVALPPRRTPKTQAEEVLDGATLPGVDLSNLATLLPPSRGSPLADGQTRVAFHVEAEGVYRPAVFIGAGATGACVLRRLKARFNEQRNPNLPIFRFLFLDTDRQTVRAVQEGTPESAFDAEETLLLPLQRPDQYGSRADNVLRWLDRRWLYNIPRSLLTEGIRPLGRLALVDNAAEFMDRLRDAIQAANSRESRRSAAELTGQAVRRSGVRIYIVASVCGGTGSGMFLDLGSAARQALADLQCGDEVFLIAVYSTSERPTEEQMARANAVAALTELQQFQRRPGENPGDPALRTATRSEVPPFSQIYIVSLGDELDVERWDAETQVIAEYLFWSCASPLGQLMDNCLSTTDSGAVDEHERVHVRTMSVSRVGTSTSRIAHRTSELAFEQIVQRWLGDTLARPMRPSASLAYSSTKSNPIAEEWADSTTPARLAELGLVFDPLREECLSAIGGGAEKVIERIVGGDAWNDPKLDAEIATDSAFKQLDQHFGADGATAGAKEGERVSEVRQRCTEIGDRHGQALIAWLEGLIDEPEHRLPFADAAARRATAELSRLIEQFEERVKAAAEQAKQLRERCNDLARSAKGWFGFGRKPKPASELRTSLAEYGQLRAQTLTLIGSIEAARRVYRMVAPIRENWIPLRRWLEVFHERLSLATAPEDGETLHSTCVLDLLPPGSESVEQAARFIASSLSADRMSELDRKVQAELLNPMGGLRGLLERTPAELDLLNKEVRTRADSLVLSSIPPSDAIRLFAARHGGPNDSVETLIGVTSENEPKVKVVGSWRRILLALPPGDLSNELRRRFAQMFEADLVSSIDSEGDFVAVFEDAHLALPLVARALVGDLTTYSDVVHRLLTRTDVRWSPIA